MLQRMLKIMLSILGQSNGRQDGKQFLDAQDCQAHCRLLLVPKSHPVKVVTPSLHCLMSGGLHTSTPFVLNKTPTYISNCPQEEGTNLITYKG